VCLRKGREGGREGGGEEVVPVCLSFVSSKNEKPIYGITNRRFAFPLVLARAGRLGFVVSS